MAKLLLVSVFILFSLQSATLSQSRRYRDPFTPTIVEQPPPMPDDAGYFDEIEEVEPLGVVIQGIIWTPDMPQAIIDGEVYKKGDTLNTIDAKILEIKKDTVSIMYDTVIYHEKVTKE